MPPTWLSNYIHTVSITVVCKQKKNNLPARQLTDSKQNIVLSACIILYDILTPKFNSWIYVGVMECPSLFSATVTLISGVRSRKYAPTADRLYYLW